MTRRLLALALTGLLALAAQAAATPAPRALPPDVSEAAASLRVADGIQTVSGEALRRAVRDFVEANAARPGVRARVEFVGKCEDVQVPLGRVEFDVHPPRKGDLAGQIAFLVEVFVGGERRARVFVNARLHAVATAYAAARRIARFQTIVREDLQPVEVDLARAGGDVILDPAEIVGRRARQTVGKGALLTARMVEVPPVVKRGDMVTILVAAGPMTIRAAGQVGQDGRKDERIKVVNLESQRVVYARVLDRNTVQVDF